MKKKFLLFVLLVLSSFTLIAQNNEKDETYLINEIGEFELKKKKLFDTFTNGRVIRENAMDEAINKIFMKKEEVKYKRYRAAELLEDGMTPAEVAIDERVASYNHVREDAINYCKDKIENELLLQKQINELEEYYDNIENTTDRTISTLGNELRVASVGYNGDKKGWILNICVNFGSIENFYTTSVLPYKLLFQGIFCNNTWCAV